MLAEARGALRVGPGRRRAATSTWRRWSGCSARRVEAGRGDARVERAGHDQPGRESSPLAQARGVPVLVDGAQAAPHLASTCRTWAPTSTSSPATSSTGRPASACCGRKREHSRGHAALAGRRRHDRARSPSSGPPGTTLPYKFEAGTPDIAGAVGLAAALDYVAAIGLRRHRRPRGGRAAPAEAALRSIPGVRLLGTPRPAGRRGLLHGGRHPPPRLATIVDRQGVAIRAGHHCAQPLMQRFGSRPPPGPPSPLLHPRRRRGAGARPPRRRRGLRVSHIDRAQPISTRR